VLGGLGDVRTEAQHTGNKGPVGKRKDPFERLQQEGWSGPLTVEATKRSVKLPAALAAPLCEHNLFLEMTDTQAVGLLLTWGGRVELDLFVEMLPQRGKRGQACTSDAVTELNRSELHPTCSTLGYAVFHFSRSSLIRCDH
ncbi:hypothetical protein EJB05_25971, partial [Eragrostis curvula]